MDMELSQEQEMLRKSAQDFLARECPTTVVRKLEESPLGYSPDMWKKMADLGWLGIPFPDTYGGLGGSAIDLVVLNKELGRAICPSPYLSTVVLSGGAILAAGSDAQKRDILPKIVEGKAIVAFAFQEPSRYYDPRGISTTANKQGTGWVISGSKMFIEFDENANYYLVTARTSKTADVNKGLTMFLVDAKAAGISRTRLLTMARDPESEIKFNNVAVPASAVVGEVGNAWSVLEKVIDKGIVTFAGYMVGSSEKIHQMAIEYSKTRVQFGRPIGAFQSIQHYMAQNITEIFAADSFTYYTAWAVDSGNATKELIAKCKAFVGDTYRNSGFIGTQIFGGIGTAVESDTTLFLRRCKQAQLQMGDSGFYEDIVAAEILDK